MITRNIRGRLIRRIGGTSCNQMINNIRSERVNIIGNRCNQLRNITIAIRILSIICITNRVRSLGINRISHKIGICIIIIMCVRSCADSSCNRMFTVLVVAIVVVVVVVVLSLVILLLLLVYVVLLKVAIVVVVVVVVVAV